MLVCALGDLLLDVVVRLEGAPASGDDTPASTRVTAGGQAANVAAWAVALGAEARLIAKRGSGGAAELAVAEVAARGVELVGPVVADDGGVVVSVVDGSGERSMLTDRGPSQELRPDEIDVGWLRSCDVLHLSGYALLAGSIAEAGARAAGAARAQGALISVDLATARGIVDFGAERVFARLDQLRPDVAFGGEREVAALGREPPATTLVIKYGASGVAVVCNGRREEHDARPAEVVDPTGAGDALAAGFLVGGIELGLEAAGRCVSQAGAMP
jgi:sugar/nucleoside kinase (ribokinase family)